MFPKTKNLNLAQRPALQMSLDQNVHRDSQRDIADMNDKVEKM